MDREFIFSVERLLSPTTSRAQHTKQTSTATATVRHCHCLRHHTATATTLSFSSAAAVAAAAAIVILVSVIKNSLPAWKHAFVAANDKSPRLSRPRCLNARKDRGLP